MLLFSSTLALSFSGEYLGLHQIDHAQAGARRLVAVGGADAALGGADLVAALAHFALLVERAVIGQDEVRAVADQQVLADLDAALLASPRFPRTSATGIDDDAVGDDALLSARAGCRRG